MEYTITRWVIKKVGSGPHGYQVRQLTLGGPGFKTVIEEVTVPGQTGLTKQEAIEAVKRIRSQA